MISEPASLFWRLIREFTIVRAWRITSSANTVDSLLLANRKSAKARIFTSKPDLFVPKMRAAQISRPGGPLEIVEREIPEPGAGWVRVRVQACGICHSVSLVKEGHLGGLQYSRVPGHEVVSVIGAVGEGVTAWKPGQRVGVGWRGGPYDGCRCNGGDAGWFGTRRHFDDRRCAGSHLSFASPPDLRKASSQGLVFRHCPEFARHAQVQCTDWSQIHE